MADGDEGHFVPGMFIAGRYRLLASHGGRPQLCFWHAVDTASGRDVALSLVDPARELPEEFVHEILARTVRLKGIRTGGVARVLDVLHTGSFGVVVSDWTHGNSLRQAADTERAPETLRGRCSRSRQRPRTLIGPGSYCPSTTPAGYASAAMATRYSRFQPRCPRPHRSPTSAASVAPCTGCCFVSGRRTPSH